MFEDPTGRDPYTAAQLVQKLLLQASFFFFAKTSDAGLFYFYFESPLHSQFYTVKKKPVAGLYFCLKVLYIASFM